MALIQNAMENKSKHTSFNSDMSRPHTASVRITEFGNSTGLNPQPLKPEDDVELLEEFLSPRKLRALTGIDDLDKVEFLEMQVDADGASLGNFGMYLPNLKQLKLSNSIIPSVRDLGTSLSNLEVLWMPRCCLECLDGLVTMSNLKELYLAYNEIRDVSPCGMLEYLEILDLEGNLVSDYRNLAYLSMCPRLQRLSLEGNPICLSTEEEKPTTTYRNMVMQTLPQLVYLDDVPVTEEPEEPSQEESGRPSSCTATLEFDSHWDYINILLKDTGLIANSEEAAGSFDAPLSPETEDTTQSNAVLATPRMPTRGQSTPMDRPYSTLRPNSGQKRHQSSRGRLGTASSGNSSSYIRPPSATSVASFEDVGSDATDESILTHGNIVCGNISKALRIRRHTKKRPPTTGDEFSSTTSSPRPISSSSGPVIGTAGDSSWRPFSAQPNTRKTVGIVSNSDSGSGDARGSWMNPEEGEMSRRRLVAMGRRGDTPDSGFPTSAGSEKIGEEFDDILVELKQWRQSYEKTRQEIEIDRAPQVLTITHDESQDIIESSDEVDSDVDDINSTPGYTEKQHPLPKTKLGNDQPPSPDFAATLLPGPSNVKSPNVDSFAGSKPLSSTSTMMEFRSAVPQPANNLRSQMRRLRVGGDNTSDTCEGSSTQREITSGGASKSPVIGTGLMESLNKHKPMPQIPSVDPASSPVSERPFSNSTSPAAGSVSSNLGAKIRRPLPVLPSKPSFPKSTN